MDNTELYKSLNKAIANLNRQERVDGYKPIRRPLKKYKGSLATYNPQTGKNDYI